MVKETEARVNELLKTLDKYTMANLGQRRMYLKRTVAVVQKRGDDDYMMYYFDHKDSIESLDIRDSNRFDRFNREELVNFLNEELVEWYDL